MSTDNSKLVMWQETLRYHGTKEERDAAFEEFKKKPGGCHFVMGGDHVPSDPMRPIYEANPKPEKKTKTPPPKKEPVRRDHKPLSKTRSHRPSKATKPVESEKAAATKALDAFMGHSS